ncbi:MAG: glycosyl hydrolase family 8 [Acidobacteriota bacterium]
MSPSRSSFLAGVCALAALLLASPKSVLAADAHPEWTYYKATFIQKDGRVIDFFNKQMSHSEGQSFTMYLSLAFDEPELFDTVWTWARNNLATPESEGLFAWSWGRRDDGSWGVLDANNATDGDIFLAWTLLRAGERWKRQDYIDASRTIARAIRERLTVTSGAYTILLPGRDGFVKQDEVAFNPSYFIFPAFYDLARSGDADFWRKLHASCREVLSKTLAGPLSLPPDWVLLAKGVFSPWGERGRSFSYDAIRVPLYLAWDLDRKSLAGFTPLLDMFKDKGTLPASIGVVAGVGNEGTASAGFYAVLARTAETLGDGGTAADLWRKAESLLPNEKQNYYSYVLFLMAKTRGLQ